MESRHSVEVSVPPPPGRLFTTSPPFALLRIAMQFSIVTPSFRQLSWLKRAVRSVADQKGVEVEHIIQDAGTGPELETWVRENSNAQLFVEKDNGMYDAVNRGLARAQGEICAYLNCDEQYLPGTLEKVAQCF